MPYKNEKCVVTSSRYYIFSKIFMYINSKLFNCNTLTDKWLYNKHYFTNVDAKNKFP